MGTDLSVQSKTLREREPIPTKRVHVPLSNWMCTVMDNHYMGDLNIYEKTDICGHIRK